MRPFPRYIMPHDAFIHSQKRQEPPMKKRTKMLLYSCLSAARHYCSGGLVLLKPNLTGALLMTAAIFSAAQSGTLKADEPADEPATIRCTFQPYAKPEILSDHLGLGGTNPNGGSIGVNSLYFIRDGKPWIPVMGELHFSRVPRDQWPAELAKLKAGNTRTP